MADRLSRGSHKVISYFCISLGSILTKRFKLVIILIVPISDRIMTKITVGLDEHNKVNGG